MFADPRVVRLLTGWFEQLLADAKALNTDDVLSLTRDDLGLRWPWCAVAILEAFHRMGPRWTAALEEAAAAAPGNAETVEIHLNPMEGLPREEAAVHAPPLLVAFETLEGEGADEAKLRWKALSDAVMAELTQAENAGQPKRQRSPKGDAQHLRNWGRWAYEFRVARPPQWKSQNAIAKENRVDRKAVRDGIRTAGELLNLGAYASPWGNKTDVSHR